MDGDAGKKSELMKREWLKEKRIESSENRDMENKSVIKIQSYAWSLSRRRVAVMWKYMIMIVLMLLLKYKVYIGAYCARNIKWCK